jgi:hypothetical protein
MNYIPGDTPMHFCVYSVAGAEVRRVDEATANSLFSERMAIPIGRHRIRGVKLTVPIDVAMPVIRGICYPIGQGSRTFRKVRISSHIIFEHHFQRCKNWLAQYGHLHQS